MRHVLLVAPVALDELTDARGLQWDGPRPEGLGGASPTRLALDLLGRGTSVDVVTLSPGLADDEVRRAEAGGLRVLVGAYRDRGRARDAFRVERRAVARLLAEVDRPDAPVHAHWTYEFALGALAVRPDAVVTVRDWGPVVLAFHRDAYRAVRLVMQWRVLRRARHLTAVSPYLAEHARRWSRAPVEVVPNGLPAGLLVDEVRRPQGPFTVLAVNAGFGPRKNVGALIRAFPAIRDAVPGARLRLVGEGHQPGGPAEAFARAEGIAEGVAFVGQVPPPVVLDEMDAAHVLVHPSREETFGNVLVEAMARGRPVVGGRDSGAVPWVLADGGGVLVDVEDPQRIAAAVGALADEDAWARQAAAGRRRVEDHFSQRAATDGYLALYRRALSPPGTAATPASRT